MRKPLREQNKDMEHRVLETDHTNKITVMDEKGAGGACRRYFVIKDHVSLCFQSGPYACEENARALRKIEEGLGWLRYRTVDRIRRGVEGTNKI